MIALSQSGHCEGTKGPNDGGVCYRRSEILHEWFSTPYTIKEVTSRHTVGLGYHCIILDFCDGRSLSHIRILVTDLFEPFMNIPNRHI